MTLPNGQRREDLDLAVNDENGSLKQAFDGGGNIGIGESKARSSAKTVSVIAAMLMKPGLPSVSRRSISSALRSNSPPSE
jgi:hypothetical protein